MKESNSFYKQIFWMYLFNCLVLLFISYRYTIFTGDITGFFPNLFFVTSFVSHFMLIAALPVLIGLGVYLFTKKQKLTYWLIGILLTILIVVINIDTEIYRQFRYHISPVVLSLVFGKRATDIFQFSISDYFFSFMFVALIGGAQFLFYKLSKYIVSKHIRSFFKPILGLFLVFTLVSHFLFAWSSANFYRQITQFKNVYPSFYPLTAESLLTKLNLVDKEKSAQRKALQNAVESNALQYPLMPIVSEVNNTDKKKNVLILLIDSWRFDALDSLVTPNIFEFSKYSQVFTNHYSGANMTTGGVFSIMYGLPGTYFNAFTNAEMQPVLTKEFQNQKYDLQILSSSTIENPPFNKNVFTGIPDIRLFSEGDTPAERDLFIVNNWKEYLNNKTNDNPFFGLLFFDAAHGFDYPDDFKEQFKPSLKEVDYLDISKSDDTKVPLINRYKNSLLFIDAQIKIVLEQLKEKKLLDDTIVIITGDHGQEFDDNKKGYWVHGGNFTKYQIKVPMVYYDSSLAAKEHSHLSLHYDIVPTLMQNILKVKNQIDHYSVGQNLFNSNHRNWFITGYNKRYAFITKDKITNIYESGFFDITDQNLNPIDEFIDINIMSEVLQQTGKYYSKK